MAMHLPSGKGRGRRAPMAEINVTPLVDVMLVLLIIFMVTAPLLTAGVPIDLPENRAKAVDQQQKPVQISMDAQGQIFIDDAAVTAAELPARLEQVAANKDAEGKPPQVFLRADRAIDYGQVMTVLGELNRAGLNRLSMISNNPGGE